jgi:hypothetical protein
MSEQAKIARTAKGKKPQYFSDPAIDKLLAMVLSLAGELSVTRERLDSLERLLEKSGQFRRMDIDHIKLDAEAQSERAKKRSQFLQRVLRTVQMELEGTVGDDMPSSMEDVLKHLD